MALTAVWLAGLVACLIGVESYVDHWRNGLIMLVPDDRLPILTPVAGLYGSYLLAILGFWYKPLFSSSSNSRLAQIRFWLALIPALLLNAIMVFLVWRGHFGASPSPVKADVGSAVKICGLLSFLAGPATAYYFGSQSKDGK